MSTTRASGSAGTVDSSRWRSTYSRYSSRKAAARSRTRSHRTAASSDDGSNGIHSGRRFVCTRWSGHAAPMSVSSGASREETNSSTRGDVSTTRTFGCSLETAPRSAGRISRSSAARSSSPTAAPSSTPPNRGVPFVVALTKSAARLMTSSVRRYASSAVSPHTTSPCLASTTSFSDGSSRTASPTCLASVKPGRMYGIHAASSPKHSRTRRSPSRVPASTLMASGCVWWTWSVGTNACSRVSIEARGAAGSVWQRARWATMSSSLISSRSNSGSISSRRSGVKCSRSIVARSEPEPFTHMTRCSRPTWSRAVPFADVLPPPKFATARSEPSRCEASRTCPSVSSGTADGSSGQRSSARSIIRWIVLIARTSVEGFQGRRSSNAALSSPPPPGHAGGGSSLARRPIAIARRPVRGDRVGLRPALGAHLRAQRPDVGAVGVEQRLVPAEHVAGGLRLGQRRAVDEQRPRVGLLEVDHAQHHRLHLRLDVVRLVDRQPREVTPAARQLAEDQEELERVDGADDELVVGVLAVVEVKAAEPALLRKQRDDLLDVGPLRVVAEVDEHARAVAELLAHEQRRAPVGEVGRVERGLEELVLDEQLLLLGQRGVDLAQRLDEPASARREVVLAGVVRAVGEPQRLRRRPELLRDPHALEQVVDRLAADRLVGVRHRAELVVGVLEQVRVDGADAQAELLGVAAQGRQVVDRVPGEVQRDGARGARQPVDLGGVLEALEDVARAAGLLEGGEARSGVAVAPRRRLDDERAERPLDGRDVVAGVGEPLREVVVVARRVGHVVSRVGRCIRPRPRRARPPRGRSRRGSARTWRRPRRARPSARTSSDRWRRPRPRAGRSASRARRRRAPA